MEGIMEKLPDERMSSEESEGKCIYFMEKNDTRGPFTVEQILKMSWDKKFDELTPFHIVTNGNSAGKDTKFQSFAERNGVLSSSFHTPLEVESEEDRKLLPIEMGFRMLGLKFASSFAKAYLGIFEMFRIGKTEMIEWLSNHISVLENKFKTLSVEVKKKALDELVHQMEMKPYLLCSVCDRFMFTAFNTFFHMSTPDHVDKMNKKSETFGKVNKLISMMVAVINPETVHEENKALN
ncbi:hypothetical protein PMAYCL1PPCAC_00445, partial [Pristionchus mayeri]